MKVFNFASFLLIAVGLSSCTKTKEIIKEKGEQLIEGYWSDINGFAIEFEDDEANISSFGNSGFDTDQKVFNASYDPFLRRITSTGPNTWRAEIAIGKFNALGVLQEISYEETELKINETGNQKTLLSSNPNGYLQVMFQGSSHGTQNCDTTTREYYKKENNSEMTSPQDPESKNAYKDFKLFYYWKKTFNDPAQCFFVVKTDDMVDRTQYPNAGERYYTLYFPDALKEGKYKLTSDGFLFYGGDGTQEVHVTWGGAGKTRDNSPGNLEVKKEGNNWKIIGEDIHLKNDVYVDRGIHSFELYVPQN